jgi:hypothetical protein
VSFPSLHVPFLFLNMGCENFILILSYHQRLAPESCLFSPGFSSQSLYSFFSPYSCQNPRLLIPLNKQISPILRLCLIFRNLLTYIIISQHNVCVCLCVGFVLCVCVCVCVCVCARARAVVICVLYPDWGFSYPDCPAAVNKYIVYRITICCQLCFTTTCFDTTKPSSGIIFKVYKLTVYIWDPKGL